MFDLPVSLIEAPRVISEFGLESRTKIIEGDALKRVEPGYEMHLLKSVIHVCNDGQAVQILSNCSAVLKAGQRLLIVERVIPNNFEYHWSRMVDMTMLVMTGGKERTENEYSSLCEKAKLKIHRIIDLPCGFNIIECLK